MIWIIGGVLDLQILLSCPCDVYEWSGVTKDERDCDLISSKYDYDNKYKPKCLMAAVELVSRLRES